jgi:hypothetical protein
MKWNFSLLYERIYGPLAKLRKVTIKANSHIPCRSHAVPMPFPCRAHAVSLPCRAATVLEYVFPI